MSVCYVTSKNKHFHPSCYRQETKTIEGRDAAGWSERELSAWPKGKSCAVCGGKTRTPIDTEQKRIQASWDRLFRDIRTMKVGEKRDEDIRVPVSQKLASSRIDVRLKKVGANKYEAQFPGRPREADYRALGLMSPTEVLTKSFVGVRQMLVSLRDKGRVRV